MLKSGDANQSTNSKTTEKCNLCIEKFPDVKEDTKQKTHGVKKNNC